MMGHLDAESIYELVEGRLDAGRARAAEAHLWRCDACRALREECAGTLDALRWYGQDTPRAPEGYWESFWTRFPAAGDVRAAERVRRRPAPVAWMAAAASISVLALGAWWAAGRLAPAGEVAPPSAAMVSAPATEVTETFDAAPRWEDDVEALRMVSFTIGSVDPLSKGVALASLAQEP